ncbi:lactonase family protein [Streptomyces sp. NBC_01476]|uniref:lactonase family protein n=1 Tax=Streptomyces sp. NBC_01476 TaxID=2903881 RepID=UPI002E338FE2|nr:lactonase family protein [Streptomyces sp. NBC_01476]
MGSGDGIDGIRAPLGGGGAARPPRTLSRRGLLAVAGTGTLAALLTGASCEARTPPPADRPAAPEPRDTAGPARLLYLGTYTTDGGGNGVGLASYDSRTGALTAAGTRDGVANPSFLARSADGSRLYAVDEQAKGAVTAMSVGADGGLEVLGAQSTGGSGPCHLSVHSGGRHLLSANYDSGSIAVHPLAADGGVLPRTDLVQHTGSGPDPDRQDGPHAHMVLSDPAGAYVLAVDLGTDTVYTYRLDPAAGKLAAVSQAPVEPGSGPRHLAFHPSARFAYLANELGDSVIVCGYGPGTGALTPGDPQPTVPAGERTEDRNYPAEVVVSADGHFVYVSNRGHDSVARFAVEDGGATLRLLDAVPAGGAYPRHISLDPSGGLLFAANQNSGTVTVFHVDQASGALTPAGTPFPTPMPVCVLP